ncbi:restriction endonuclease subunit S [Salinivibrio sp. AR647]|uniref:restriction endonuclease subunit S n=1 Tax=Salinivibrio sp. AR647 TaxID=1909438 RepID=UPI000985AC66|nr:restriction endonuclease subunit S [Salinivibrio sp. AR647]OOE92360.1 restriction endonuclease subunit S [Salinivibrio sp. AR647]
MIKLGCNTSLPSGWQWAEAGKVIDIRDGTHDSPKPVEDGIPLVTSKNLKNGKIDFSTCTNISAEDHEQISKRSAVDDGDILYAMIGTIGNPVIVQGDRDFSIKNVALFKFSKSQAFNRYFYHLLGSSLVTQQFEKNARGGTQKFVSLGNIRALQIPLPPLEEQKRIAAILDKADAIRQKRKQAIDLADEFLRSVFLDMFGDPVTNPKGWETKSLKEVSEHINDCPHSTPKWTDAGVICLRTSNLTKGGWNWEDTRYVSDETYNERTKRGKLEQGDIILSREGTVGIAALVPESVEMCMGQRLVQVRANREFVLPEYLLYLLLFELEPKRITRLMAGSTSKHINVRDLKQLKILLPSIDLQKKFVEIMNKSKETTSSMVLFSSESVNSSLALSQKAFSGQL